MAEVTEFKAIDPVGSGNAHHIYTINAKSDQLVPGMQFGRIEFQTGPVKEYGINGVTNEDLLEIVIHRLKCFQTSPYVCRENAIALTKIEEGLMWLNERTRERKERKVEGTKEV